MSQEILINLTPRETRVALVENGVLQEIHLERAQRRGLVGNIYLGSVRRVLPGMQAAFIDAGLERTAFLHVSDLQRDASDPAPPIDQLIREQQSLLVQVIKDPIGDKGARVTTQITVPSRYLVLTPSSCGMGISARIEDESERARLRSIGQAINEQSEGGVGQVGLIFRTAAEGACAEEISSDREFLLRLWDSIGKRAASAQPGTLVHEDLPLYQRAMRDLANRDLERVRVDSHEGYQRLLEFCSDLLPHTLERIELYSGERPIFDLYGIEDEIERALARRVDLKSGGHLVIDQTEAMTIVDVNTGGFVGHRNVDETIFKTNLEAAQAIARQLRLRNIGGIIIVDFIDMNDPEHQRQVLRALEKSLDRDHAKTQIGEVSALGLVEMTRKRTRESLEQLTCQACPNCDGRGTVKTAETVSYEIFREILREVRQFESQRIMVLAAPSVVETLLDEESTGLAHLEEFIERPIELQVETLYAPDQFDVIPV
ncbi:ribonuclease G [Halorhodospira halochloris]|uniref:ribonuclease G n=1 Tax=Halorhodospira halochloris TaxID=1052 RepID=UPI001EE9A6C3|nr:ribonuclease G [Halorhodospira halochloris]MCG5548105.1 ribonuclease G [Halorhodospira halochloris]